MLAANKASVILTQITSIALRRNARLSTLLVDKQLQSARVTQLHCTYRRRRERQNITTCARAFISINRSLRSLRWADQFERCLYTTGSLLGRNAWFVRQRRRKCDLGLGRGKSEQDSSNARRQPSHVCAVLKC